MVRILVIGSMNMDIMNRISNHPKPGETVHSLKLSHNPGGKGANQAVAASKSGADVQMLAAVGNDDYANSLKATLSDNRIDTQYLKIVAGPTGTAFISVSDEGENTIIVAAGANEKLSVEDVITFAESGGFKQMDTLIVQNEIPIETTIVAMKKARDSGTRVIFNPAPIAGVELEMVKYADVIVLNETEASMLTEINLRKENGVKNAIHRLIQAGAGSAIITLGEDGAYFGNEEIILKETAFSVPVADTTAAGDTFVGSFAAAYGNNTKIRQALKFAIAASALAVTKEGAQPSIPMKEEVLRFLKEKTRRS